MSREQYDVISSDRDGLSLSVLRVIPDGEIKAIVQIAHGMCEHKERYLPFLRFLAEKGCLGVINDHRGHGASIRKPEDLGYFYEDGAKALVSDLRQVTAWIRTQYPDVPVILIGHSMGALAVRAYCAQDDQTIRTLVVIGNPGQKAGTGAALALLALLKRFRGDHYRSPLMRNLVIGSYEKKFLSENRPNAWLSTNRENGDGYEADPLCGFNFTVNGNIALMGLIGMANNIPESRNPDLPVFFYSGSEDPCMPDDRGFAQAAETMRQAGYRHVSARKFEGMRHEVLNEKDREKVFETIYRQAIEPQL